MSKSGIRRLLYHFFPVFGDFAEALGCVQQINVKLLKVHGCKQVTYRLKMRVNKAGLTAFGLFLARQINLPFKMVFARLSLPIMFFLPD